MKPKKFEVYLITCLVNGHSYVGITSRGLKRRWVEHLYAARNRLASGVICRAISKYGPSQFSARVICEAGSWKELCELEPVMISKFNTRAPNGYNLSDGGEGAFGNKLSADAVERSAAKHRGRPCHPNTRLVSSLFHKGRPKSAETRARMSAAMTGKTKSPEVRAKISASKMGKSCNVGTSNGGAKLTEDQVREARQRLASGESQRSIARLFGVQYTAIWKIAHGLKWKSVA